MKQNIIQDVRADLVKGAENSQKKAYERIQAPTLCFPLGNTSSGAPGPVQHFFCDDKWLKKKKVFRKAPKKRF